MTKEYERTRKQLGDLLRHFILEYEKAWCGVATMKSEQMADQIIAFNGIEIRADDQSLPEIPRRDIAHIIMERDSMLKRVGFVKVISKEKS